MRNGPARSPRRRLGGDSIVWVTWGSAAPETGVVSVERDIGALLMVLVAASGGDHSLGCDDLARESCNLITHYCNKINININFCNILHKFSGLSVVP